LRTIQAFPRTGLVLLIVAMTALTNARIASADRYWGVMSGDWSNPANWGGTLPTTTDTAWISNGGTATVSGTGAACNILALGSGGTVQMTCGTLSICYADIGCYCYHNPETGTIVQSGGTTTVSISLAVGYDSSASGSYSLSGTGQLSAPLEYVGYYGTGTFTQTGGTNTVGSDLCVGYGYYGGTGAYTQTGGINTVASNLYVGNYSRGTYSLGGTGQLSAAFEFVAYSNTGSFTQGGGANSTDYLCIGTKGSYRITAGTLSVNGSFSNQGQFDGGGGTGVLI
jgi:hypothetical protein